VASNQLDSMLAAACFESESSITQTGAALTPKYFLTKTDTSLSVKVRSQKGINGKVSRKWEALLKLLVLRFQCWGNWEALHLTGWKEYVQLLFAQTAELKPGRYFETRKPSFIL